MQQIVHYFWQMCLLRAGPEGVPPNLFVLGFTFTIYFLLSLATLLITRNDMAVVIVIAWTLVGVGIEALIVFGLLVFKRVMSRFASTMAALLGTNSLILTIMLPVNVLFEATDIAELELLVSTAFLSTFIWWLAIAGFILNKAANVSMLQGAAIAFGIEMLAISTNLSLFAPST